VAVTVASAQGPSGGPELVARPAASACGRAWARQKNRCFGWPFQIARSVYV